MLFGWRVAWKSEAVRFRALQGTRVGGWMRSLALHQGGATHPSTHTAPHLSTHPLHTCSDPVTEFVRCLFVEYDFEGAQEQLAKCEEVRTLRQGE